MNTDRASGILLPIFSLPSANGIGALGKAAYRFVDFLSAAGQKYWQILPIGPTSIGDSPYQSFSTFAGNPYFIDLDLLCRHGFLQKEDYNSIHWSDDPQRIDYARLFTLRFPVLRKAYARGYSAHADALQAFRRKNAAWIEDYALYMALKQEFSLKAWKHWPEDIRLRRPDAMKKYKEKLADEIRFWVFVQYLFFGQWRALKAYANKRGIKIIGDIPIYVAEDSADAWSHPEIFWFDGDLNPVKVAGVPPDGFSATGQLWGNPLYRWDVLEETGFEWWMERIRANACFYDVIRIDHFRGFESYYAVSYGESTAENGEWMKGPGFAFFQALREKLGDVPIIAEDLGYLTPEVRKLLSDTGYPGMKVLEFAFDSREESDYLPHNYNQNCVVYTGTHDNDTVCGWFDTAPWADVRFCKRYLRLQRREGYHWGFITAAWSSTGKLAIAQMQDFLGLSSEARINTPSTMGGNWQWRLKKQMLSAQLARKIRHLTQLYCR